MTDNIIAHVSIAARDVEAQRAKVVDSAYASLARAYLMAGLYQATRQCMIDNGGKRYQCVQKWAEAATNTLWDHLREIIPSGHPLDGAFCERSTRVLIKRDEYAWTSPAPIRFKCLYNVSGDGFKDYGNVYMTIPTAEPLEGSLDPRVAPWTHKYSCTSQNLLAEVNVGGHACKGIDAYGSEHKSLQAVYEAGEWEPYADVLYRQIQEAQTYLDNPAELTRHAAQNYIQQRHVLDVVALEEVTE